MQLLNERVTQVRISDQPSILPGVQLTKTEADQEAAKLKLCNSLYKEEARLQKFFKEKREDWLDERDKKVFRHEHRQADIKNLRRSEKDDLRELEETI